MTNAWQRPWCAELNRSHLGHEVEVVGWVRRRRDLGGLVFADLRDRSGLLQLVFEDDLVDAGQELGVEDVIRVRGVVRERPGPRTVGQDRDGEDPGRAHRSHIRC